MKWVVGSILHGGPIEVFLFPATTGETKAVVCAILCGMHRRKPESAEFSGIDPATLATLNEPAPSLLNYVTNMAG